MKLTSSASMSKPLPQGCLDSHRYIIYVMLIMLSALIVQAARDPYHLATYDHKGITCFKCKPGTFLYQHCSKSFSPSECHACPLGTYQTSYTQAPTCERCDTHCLHDVNMVVMENCSSTQNLKCRCKDGYYLHYDNYTKSSTCLVLVPCTDDKVTIKNGTLTSQYKCAKCREGEFYNSENTCQRCTLCNASNTVQLSQCNETADATCQNLPTNDNATGIIIAVTVGTIVVFFLISLGAYLFLRKKRHTTQLNRPSVEEGEKEQSRTLQPLLVKQNRTRTLSDSSTASTTSQYAGLINRQTWEHEVFQMLSRKLSDNWQSFMRNLPGDDQWKSDVNAICVQISMEERGVQEQIYKALRQWAQSQGEHYVTVDSVLHTLYKMEDCQSVRKDVKQLCRKLNKECVRKSSQVTSTTN